MLRRIKWHSRTFGPLSPTLTHRHLFGFMAAPTRECLSFVSFRDCGPTYLSPSPHSAIDSKLYFPISASFEETPDTDRLLSAIKQNAKTDIQIHKTEIVTREPLMYYRPDKERYTRFIKIYCWSTAHQNALARVLELSDKSPGLKEMMTEGKLYDLTVSPNCFGS